MNKSQLFKSNLRSFFIRLVNPSFWIQNQKTSDGMTIFVDNIINEDLALACDEFTLSTQDGRRIWTENYPYEFGGFSHLLNDKNIRSELLHGLPNVETRIRLRKYVASKFGYDAAKSDAAC
jgi:hypothetical protein